MNYAIQVDGDVFSGVHAKPEHMKYGRYQAFLETWLRRIAAAICWEKTFVWKVVIPMNDRRFMVTWRNCPLQKGHNDFGRRKKNNMGIS